MQKLVCEIAHIRSVYSPEYLHYHYVQVSPLVIERLQQQGNRSTCWKNILISKEVHQNDELLESTVAAICNNTFNIADNCHLIINRFDNNKEINSGIFNTTFMGNVYIGNNCKITNTGLICNVFVDDYASIINSGNISCKNEGSIYGNFSNISVGPETGGRNINVYYGLEYSNICYQAFDATKRIQNNNDLQQVITYNQTIIGKYAVLNFVNISNSIIGSYCQINSSTINNSTLMTSQSSPIIISEYSTLNACILHDNVQIGRYCSSENVFFIENSMLGDYARVSNSIIGPDASLSGGECHHCILGPFIGFHHHSLLIASLWPLGRGNIGYGAMIGANHTGRVNDQECWIGEGVFFGLGSAIKFPFNIMASPYSIIASSTICLPQKISFPFSLIMTNTDNSMNNIIKPGWILTSNPYMIRRSLTKFRKRRKSIQNQTDYPINRPSIIQLCKDARKRLINVLANNNNQGKNPFHDKIYTESDISGLGKNILYDIDLHAGIRSYTNYIKRYALLGLLPAISKFVVSNFTIPDFNNNNLWKDGNFASYFNDNASSLDLLKSDFMLYNSTFTNDYDNVLWDHQKYILIQEYYGIDFQKCFQNKDNLIELVPLLDELIELEKNHFKSLTDCKNRDSIRGNEIFEDYSIVHASSDGINDAIILDCQQQMERIVTSINSIKSIFSL